MSTRMHIKIEGLPKLLDDLKWLDRRLCGELKKGIKEDAQPILRSAKSFAAALGGTGQYSRSFSLRSIKTGAKIVSDDPGAGTMEFARPGAFALRGRRRGLPVGVPRGMPPRALIKSSLMHEDEVKRSVESRISKIIEGVFNG